MALPEQPLSSRLDRFLLRYQWQTQHSLESGASREACYNALVHARHRSPIASLLLNIRGLRSNGTLKESLLRNGFTLLEESPPDAFIVGLVCKPWLWSGGIACYDNPDDWLRDQRSDVARIVMILGTEEAGKGVTRLYTETRVCVDDVKARRKFAKYWLLVGPFSGFIRRAWLRDAKKTAERSA